MNIRCIVGVWLSLFISTHVSSQSFYGKVIHTDPATSKRLSETIRDMQYHLQKISRDSILIDTKDTSWQHGICIIKLDRNKDTAFAQRLDRTNANTFIIRSDGLSSIQIISYSPIGLTNGIYTYLDLLGFRWFHPGDLWTHIPKRKNIQLKMDSVFKPDFLMTGFFGSYGTPRNNLLDKNQYVDKQWSLWAVRNRQTSDYGMGGHAWNEFLWANINELKQHPEYMALVDSHRVFPNTATKFCISNKGLRELFVNYQVNKLQKKINNDPGAFHYFVSVEPSDGYGDCQCSECRKMGSNSTRVFSLANDVGVAFQKISPIAQVTLLAYNTHADTPNIKLESNVDVQLVPYRFQHVMSAEGLIGAWEKKKDTLFMYDYYGLPLWNADMPLTGPLRPFAYPSRVQYWYKHGVKGALLESTNSIGAAGLGLYLYYRYGWYINTNIDSVMNEYYTFNYGKGANAMYQAQNHLVNTLDKQAGLYNAFVIMSTKINKRTLKPDERHRMVDYESYLHYLKLLYDFKGANGKNVIQATDTLVRYAHSIFLRMMISQTPFIEHLCTFGPTADYIRSHWDAGKMNSKESKFPTVTQWTDTQIEESFKEDYRQMRNARPPDQRGVPQDYGK